MIRYALKCNNDHGFESWFQSGPAYDALKSAGHVACPLCGSVSVDKVLMAPGVPARGNRKSDAPAPVSPPSPVAAVPDPTIAKALADLRAHVEANSDYVGVKFAEQATAMHLGDMPQRSIYGEVRIEDAKRLAEDGVPAMPLPFIPRSKTN
jgi:hypothetical protein